MNVIVVISQIVVLTKVRERTAEQGVTNFIEFHYILFFNQQQHQTSQTPSPQSCFTHSQTNKCRHHGKRKVSPTTTKTFSNVVIVTTTRPPHRFFVVVPHHICALPCKRKKITLLRKRRIANTRLNSNLPLNSYPLKFSRLLNSIPRNFTSPPLALDAVDQQRSRQHNNKDPAKTVWNVQPVPGIPKPKKRFQWQ